MAYWLMKSEPETYSIERLIKDGETPWEGVRNYQARNFMMNEMKPGDEVLFYHSSADPSGVAGVAKVMTGAAADALQFDRKSEVFDAKATKAKPIWFCVKIGAGKKFKKFVSLNELRGQPALAEMFVLRKGQRLSIQPVTKKEFETVMKLGGL
jgi:predicted RNA-binding protein with PUA-like domain